MLLQSRQDPVHQSPVLEQVVGEDAVGQVRHDLSVRMGQHKNVLSEESLFKQN